MSRLPRWSSATLAPKPSTASPIRCSAASTVATPRSSARKPCCRAWLRWSANTARSPAACWPRIGRWLPRQKPPPKRQTAERADIHGAARRHAAVGRRHRCAPRSRVHQDRHNRERHCREPTRAGASPPAPALQDFDAVIMASPAWAAGCAAPRGRCRTWRRACRHPLFLVDHRQPGLRRGQARRAARGLRIPRPGQRAPRHAGLHLCRIASFSAARRPAKPSFAPSLAA